MPSEFYCFGCHKSETAKFLVFSQVSANVDLTPVHNMEQERLCGDIDPRLKRRPSLKGASRSVILEGNAKLHKKMEVVTVRNMGKKVQAIKARNAQVDRQSKLESTGMNTLAC